MTPLPGALPRSTTQRLPGGFRRGRIIRAIGLAALAFATLLLAYPADASSISREFIRRPIRQRMKRVRRCHQQALTRNPKLPDGRMLVRFHVDHRGIVTIARTLEDDVGDAALASCVRRMLLSIHYGSSPGDEGITIYYPFHFRKG